MYSSHSWFARAAQGVASGYGLGAVRVACGCSLLLAHSVNGCDPMLFLVRSAHYTDILYLSHSD